MKKITPAGSKGRSNNTSDSGSSSQDSPSARKRGEASRARLPSILKEFCQASNLNARLLHFSKLVNWIRSGDRSASISLRIDRLNDLLTLLEMESDLRAQFQNAFHAMLGETQAVSLFAEAGLHPRESIWSEGVRRLVERVLPSARADADLSKFVFRLHPDDRYISGFLDWPEGLFRRVIKVLSPEDAPTYWDRQCDDLGQSLCLLGIHLAGVGLGPEFRARCHPYPVEESPFYRVQRLADELVRMGSTAKVQPLLESLRLETTRCRIELEYMHERMENTGVSTALESDMGTIERALRRITCITEVLFP